MDVRPVETRSEREAFIRLPDRLYADALSYVPPLLLDRREAIDARKNPYFEHARVRFWLAWRGDEPVGRISAQVDELYFQQHGEHVGHFGFLDAEDDPLIFRALLDTAEDWLRSQGMQAATGPFSLSINQECGTLVDGFDSPSMLLMGYDPPYADTHIRSAGYEKARDLLCYRYDGFSTPEIMSERLRLRGRIKDRLHVRQLDPKRFDSEIHVILDIFNEAWRGNWGFLPFTESEIAEVGKKLKPILEPRFVLVAELDGEPVSMAICLPNIDEAIADLNGRLLPLGWAKLLWRLKVKRPDSCRVLLFGLKPAYQQTVTGSVVIMQILQRLRQNGLDLGYKWGELSWILEDNMEMRRVIEALGGEVYKTYRIYRKELDH